MTKPTSVQSDKMLGVLAKQMLSRAKAGDFDLLISYVKRGEPKTFRSHAHTTLFGVVVSVMDSLARMGATEEDQKVVRDTMEMVIMRSAGRISQAEGRPVEAEAPEVQQA